MVAFFETVYKGFYCLWLVACWFVFTVQFEQHWFKITSKIHSQKVRLSARHSSWAGISFCFKRLHDEFCSPLSVLSDCANVLKLNGQSGKFYRKYLIHMRQQSKKDNSAYYSTRAFICPRKANICSQLFYTLSNFITLARVELYRSQTQIMQVLCSPHYYQLFLIICQKLIHIHCSVRHIHFVVSGGLFLLHNPIYMGQKLRDFLWNNICIISIHVHCNKFFRVSLQPESAFVLKSFFEAAYK